MAVSHIGVNENTTYGRLLRDMLSMLEDGHDRLNELIAAMALMIDGDGSQAAHFTYITTKFGYASDAISKSAWEELNSLASKFNTDASVSSVKAAIAQALAKFR